MPRPEQKSGSLGLSENLNKKVNPFLADDGFYKCSGFHLDEALSITKWNGFQKFNNIPLLETGSPATFTGIFHYAKSDQTYKHLATTTKGFYLFNSPIGSAWNALDLTGCGGARTGTANDLFDSIILNDILYLGNGVDGNIKYDGNNYPRNMGITAPTVVATASLGGTGITAVTGYQYKYTYYNSTLGHESNPVAMPSVTTGPFTDKTVTVTCTCSADPQVNKIRIYRTTDGGAVWLYVGQIDDTGTTNTFTDNFADTTLGVAVDQFGNGVPPIFAFIALWKGHAFMVPKNSSTVYFSKAGYPNAVDSNDYRELGKNDGSVITGMALINDTLVIYKGNSIWNAVGDDRYSFGFIKQPPTVGAISNQSIVAVPGSGIHYFASQDGFYVYNGIASGIAGIGVQKDYLAFNQSRLNVIGGRPHKSRKLLIWIASSGSSTQNDTIVWFDYLQNKWGTRDISNVKANVIANMMDESNREQFYIGGYDGYVYVGDSGGSDNGSDILCDVIDRAHPKADANNENVKCFTHLFLWFSPLSGATINVSYAIDNPDGPYISLGTIDASNPSGQNHIHFKALGRRIYPRFIESSKLQGIVYRGWRLYYRDMGRHNRP